MDSSAPLRRSTGRLLLLAYIPVLVFSIAGAGWMLWHSMPAFVGLFVWMAIVGLFGLLMGSLGTASLFGGLAACHALAAFAMHAWLKLPSWTTGVFVLTSFVLLATMLVRAMIASGSADCPYED